MKIELEDALFVFAGAVLGTAAYIILGPTIFTPIVKAISGTATS